ncbi:MAG: homoaconitase, partial [bacterium]|nr:homoaconitase [bacterium]
PCIGMGKGLLGDGEIGISATNRNFKGRMGSRDAKAYLASPSVVAASAVAGKITGPEIFETTEPVVGIKENKKAASEAGAVKILDGMPSFIEGELVFCHQDNLNTDGIYPGKYTYNEDITPDEQAQVAMENYDPDFGNIAGDGDVLAGGFNFGTGSSREQAATALKYKGIRLILAGSFSETYKRNALNNGFLTIEAPVLISELKDKFGADKLTVRTGIKAKIDFAESKIITSEKEYDISPVGSTAQELILSEGLENWIKERI